MAYNEELANRIRAIMKRRKGITERKMFGGVAFMVNGNMCCGVVDDEIVLRLGDEGAAAALERKHTREMDFTGKPLKSMVYVSAAGIKTDASLRKWVLEGLEFARSLPAK